MCSNLRKFRAREDGSSTIEFVMWMPLLAFILFLVVDTSLVFVGQTNLLKVTADVSRQLSVGALNDTEVDAYFEARGYDPGQVTAKVERSGKTVRINSSLPVSTLEITGIYSSLGYKTVSASAAQLDELS